MVDVPVATLDGQGSMLSVATVEELEQRLRGQLIAPGDDSYDEARQVWNANIDRRPGLICRPAGVADVITAVNFARDHHLLVSVRGGAHSLAGTCVCDDGLVIDMSLMKGIRVDPVRRTVRAEGGVKWGNFDRETQAFGLATTGGTVSDTGIAGLTLGGGLGWLGYKYGLVCDNLLPVDLVTADGQLRMASDTEHPDLFWGLHGGGELRRGHRLRVPPLSCRPGAGGFGAPRPLDPRPVAGTAALQHRRGLRQQHRARGKGRRRPSQGSLRL
jgi:FAD/FMN-containing dehydrogenase